MNVQVNTDKDFTQLIKNIETKINTKDEINNALIDQYPSCEPLFQTMWKNLQSLTTKNISETMITLHSLKGHVRNIGCFTLGSLYHKLENIGQYIIDKSRNEFTEQFNIELFEIELNRCQPYIQNVFNKVNFLHKNYMRNNFNVNLNQIEHQEHYHERNKTESVFQIKEKHISNVIDKLIQNRTQNQELNTLSSQIHQQTSEFQDLLLNQNIDQNEIIFYLTKFLAELDRNIGVIQTTVTKQEKNNQYMLDNMLKTRLINISNYSESFYEIIRKTSSYHNKMCHLDIIGESIEIDKNIMDKLSFAINHLLTNAVVHGIEDEITRLTNNKSQIGKIKLEFKQIGKFLSITLQDDGCGINIQKIQEIVKDKFPNVNTADFKEQDWAQLIFYSGLSTKTSIDEFSGRGIGLESVKKTVHGLGGQISVSSNKNGTKFIINIPINQIISNFIVVKALNNLYAIPNILIDTILTVDYYFYSEFLRNKEFVDLSKIYEYYSGDKFDLPNYRKTPCTTFNKLVNEIDNFSVKNKYMILVINYLNEKAVVIVEDIVTKAETIMENIGKLQNTNGVLGAIVVNNQSALVLNPILLMNNYKTELGQEQLKHDSYALIVDDSKIACFTEQQSLKKINLKSIAKEDGKIAYDYLCNNLSYLPSVILTDFEMPNMNGLEFAEAVKKHPKLKHIPILMITSKSLETYQAEAEKIGIVKLIGKPFNENELFSLLKDLKVVI